MDSAVVILVIVVSAALVFLLVLSIILAIILIRISCRIKNIADRADMIANHTNETVANIGKVTNAINLIKIIVAAINIFSKNKTRSRRG